jgi:CRISPR-associated endoribonuclease Cas6
VKKIHIEICLNAEEPLYLPIHYNHIVQAVIYNLLDEKMASFLHKKGFKYEKRAFKMFAFSKLLGRFKFKKSEQKITFYTPVSLIISSPYDDFCNSLASSLVLRKKIKMGHTDLVASAITLNKETVEDNKILIKTLSPIVAYSTFLKPSGGKYTCYFQPGEKEHNRIITNNIKKKFVAFYGLEPPKGDIELKPLEQPKLSIINYKGTVIKGYSGKFIMEGPTSLIQMSIDSGLGSKNSQGFGCLKPVK